MPFHPHDLDVAISVSASIFVSASGFNSDCEGSLPQSSVGLAHQSHAPTLIGSGQGRVCFSLRGRRYL